VQFDRVVEHVRCAVEGVGTRHYAAGREIRAATHPAARQT
jgi:hypothetical protein